MRNSTASFLILLITCSMVYANDFPAENKPWWKESYGMIAGFGFADDRTGEFHSIKGHFGGFWTNGDYLYQLDISASEELDDETIDAGETSKFVTSEAINFHIGEFGYWYAANGFAMIGGGITKRYEKQKECIPDEFSDDCYHGFLFRDGDYKNQKTTIRYLPHIRLTTGLGYKMLIHGAGLNAFVHIDPMDVQYGLGLHVALGKLWL